MLGHSPQAHSISVDGEPRYQIGRKWWLASIVADLISSTDHAHSHDDLQVKQKGEWKRRREMNLPLLFMSSGLWVGPNENDNT